MGERAYTNNSQAIWSQNIKIKDTPPKAFILCD